jgi:hypothetical protein
MRAFWILRYVGDIQSRIVRSLVGSSDLWRRSVAGQGIRTLTELNRELESPSGTLLTRGHAIVVHVLLPHGPIDVDAECRILGYGEARIHPRDEAPSEDRWREILQGWGGQSRCAHKLLGETIAIVDRRIGRENSIIIVQGDHGWRMNKTVDMDEVLEAYSPDKLNNNFSTLFAIRRPGVPASVVREATPVQDLLWTLADSNFVALGASLPWEHFVRKYPTRSGLRPELRRLAASEMPWAHAPSAFH